MKNLIEFFKCAADKDSIFNNYIHLVTFADGTLRIRTVAHINFHFFFHYLYRVKEALPVICISIMTFLNNYSDQKVKNASKTYCVHIYYYD